MCANGRRSDEILGALTTRMQNDPVDEVRIAAGEQRKITRLRLEKLVGEEATVP